MIPYVEEHRAYIDGVPCQYLCHIQKTESSGLVFPAHFHYYIELLYALTGKFKVYLNGSYHEFESGDLVLINSREIHQIEALSPDGGNYIVVRFLPDLIYNSMSQNHFELKYVLPFITDNASYEKIIKKSALQKSNLPFLLQEIIRESEEQRYGYELAIKNHIGQTFLWILRYWYSKESNPIVESSADFELKLQLSPALTYMTNYFDKPITAAEMAELCHLSYSYFSRSFNRLMHMSFSNYLNYIRVKEAEKLMVTTNLSITEISMAVGFSSTSYFIKLFKEYKHISPKQYRKQIILQPPTICV